MAEYAEYLTNANKALNISLVAPSEGGLKKLNSFNPTFTHTIFGDEETIFGYKNLKVNLRFHACDMRPNLHIIGKKCKTIGETAPTDVKEILEEFLPQNAYEKTAAFESAIAADLYSEWKPPGELITTLESDGKVYEIWKGSLLDPAVQQMVKRLQILVLFFIDGGSLIDLDVAEWSLKRWSIFFLYEKNEATPASKSPYLFMGYATVHRFYYYRLTATPTGSSDKTERVNRPASLDWTLPPPETSALDDEGRARISQFLILPPFQGSGHGSRFYNAIFDHYLSDPGTQEITIEDPSDAFDDMRDLNDLTRLRKIPLFANARINNVPVPFKTHRRLPTSQIIERRDALEELRKQQKMAPRQFNRVLELQLLSTISTTVRQSLVAEKRTGDEAELAKEEREYYRLWKLICTQRLYKHNKEWMLQLERSERAENLKDPMGRVEAGYARLLRVVEEKEKGSELAEGAGSMKRPRDEMSQAEEDQGDEPEAKKTKVDG